MNLLHHFSLFSILAALTLSVPARADIAPEDSCSASALGKACDNATGGSAGFVAGVCKEAMCSRATPDGPMTYACFRCEVAEPNIGGQPNEAAGAGAGGGGQTDVGGSSTAGAATHSPGGMSTGGAPSSSAGGAGTAGAKTGSGGISSPTKPSDDGGCSVSQARGGAGLAAALTALGLMVAALRRRRSLAG